MRPSKYSLVELVFFTGVGDVALGLRVVLPVVRQDKIIIR